MWNFQEKYHWSERFLYLHAFRDTHTHTYTCVQKRCNFSLSQCFCEWFGLNFSESICEPTKSSSKHNPWQFVPIPAKIKEKQYDLSWLCFSLTGVTAVLVCIWCWLIVLLSFLLHLTVASCALVWFHHQKFCNVSFLMHWKLPVIWVKIVSVLNLNYYRKPSWQFQDGKQCLSRWKWNAIEVSIFFEPRSGFNFSGTIEYLYRSRMLTITLRCGEQCGEENVNLIPNAVPRGKKIVIFCEIWVNA